MDQFVQLKDFVSAQSTGGFLFYTLSIFAVALSIGVISDRNVIRSGFLLIGVFGTISGLFLLLQAQFLALAQIMIYAVGITLVVVIALMLTNPRLEKEASEEEEGLKETGFLKIIQDLKNGLPAMVGILSFFTIHAAIRSESTSWVTHNEPLTTYNIQLLGQELTTTYSLPFEFASVLLLAALVGAIMLAKADRQDKDVSIAKED